jgi:phage-related tail fiber protein
MAFRTIHTTAGLLAMAQAEALGGTINLAHMAVGDGNGVAVAPAEDQATLVRERFRATINRVFKPDPDGRPNAFAAELVIPASEGGFVLREVGVFDSYGSLLLVGDLPETYKPEASEGAFADTVVRVEFEVSNVGVVTIIADPAVAVATQSWVSNAVTAAYILPGGTTGQIATKASNADGDILWADPTDVNVTVSTIEELQTLAALQTQVDLALVNTTGLAVYIDGLRLPDAPGVDGWQPDGTIITRLHLGQAYAAGAQIIAVQNEPASDLPDALLQAQNLADVPDKALGRANLGVMSIAQTKQRTPAGAVLDFAMATAPTGWLKCNGAEISRSAYADLFNAVGTAWGVGNGVTTFNLPDLRGEFRRGWDDGRGIDAWRAFATAQASAVGSHRHSIAKVATARGIEPWNGGSGQDWNINSAGFTGYSGGAETRPRNVAMLACIKY